MNVQIRGIFLDDLASLWEVAYRNPNAEWTKWNGPYFKDVLPTR